MAMTAATTSTTVAPSQPMMARSLICHSFTTA